MLGGVIHVQPGGDAASLDNQDSGSHTVIAYPPTLAVVTEPLDEVGPNRGVEVMSSGQARYGLSDFVFYGQAYVPRQLMEKLTKLMAVKSQE